jgi:hypothetical protein
MLEEEMIEIVGSVSSTYVEQASITTWENIDQMMSLCLQATPCHIDFRCAKTPPTDNSHANFYSLNHRRVQTEAFKCGHSHCES